MFILFNISILNSSRFTCKANRVDLWGWKFHLIRPPEPSLGVATTFGVEVMQVNQIWLTIADKLSNAMEHNVHRTIEVGSSLTLTSSGNSGMRSYRKCKGCNQTDKRAVKSVKLKSALKSIRPTNFHTLVNQGFCGRACVHWAKSAIKRRLFRMLSMQRHLRSEWRPYWTNGQPTLQFSTGSPTEKMCLFQWALTKQPVNQHPRF